MDELNAIARILGIAPYILGSETAELTFMYVHWADLRYEQTSAICATIGENYQYSEANSMLGTLCGVLQLAYEMGQIPEAEYLKAIDLRPFEPHEAKQPVKESLEWKATRREKDAILRARRDDTAFIIQYLPANLNYPIRWILTIYDHGEHMPDHKCSDLLDAMEKAETYQPWKRDFTAPSDGQKLF